MGKHNRKSVNGRGSRYPDITDQEIVDLVLSGVPGIHIADRYGFTDSVIVQRVKHATGMTPTELKLENGWVTSTCSPAAADEIADWYEADPQRTLGETLAHFNVSGETVKLVLESRGIAPRTWMGRFTVEEKKEIARRYKAGETCVDLGRVFDCSEKNIRTILDQEGVPRRPKAVVAQMIADKKKTKEEE